MDSSQELGSQGWLPLRCHGDCWLCGNVAVSQEWSLWQLSTLPNQSYGWNLWSTIQWIVWQQSTGTSLWDKVAVCEPPSGALAMDGDLMHME